MQYHGFARRGIAVAKPTCPWSNADVTDPVQSDVPTVGVDTEPQDRDEGHALAEGTKIGRYVVLDVVGHGGMGVVMAAVDPKLARKIAIKLLHAGTPADAQTRLQREAQALARLAHPNVIRIHDVGTHEGRVFIAMELIEGQTLAEWLATEPTWRETLRVFGLAGQGLAAAHAAGLIHRDFKPSNVLMGKNGQVKVTDFGLARAQGPSASPQADDDATESLHDLDASALESTLTRTGALVGTPAYMAPEQLERGAIDPRSDQFSFCVALYEGLAGRRPFAGGTPWDIEASILAQRFAVGFRPGIPSGVRRAVRRGLLVDPAQRHPDLVSLLDALQRGRTAGRRHATWAAAIALMGVGVWWAQPSPPPAAAEYCATVAERLVGVWDDERRERAAKAFHDTNLLYADGTWVAVRDEIDRQASAWVDAQRQACEAKAALPSVTEGASNDEAQGIDRQMVCLHRRFAEIRQLGDLLVDADEELVERAPRAVEALGSVAACTRDQSLSIGEGPAALVHAEALASITVLQEAGRYEEALEAAAASRERAESGPRAMQAEAAFAHARAAEDAGKHEEAERSFHDAFSAAVASGHHEVAIRAALGLAVRNSKRSKPRFDEAERWTEHARASLDQWEPQRKYSADIESVRAQIDLRRGEQEAALEHGERALALRTDELGADHYRLASYHNNLGNILGDLQRLDESIDHMLVALELEKGQYGARHPRVGRALSALCASYSDAGRLEPAIASGTEAVELLRSSVGERHPFLGSALINLGTAYSRSGREDDAERSFLDALANVEAVNGPKHRRVGLVLNNLGVHYELRGQLAEAERYHRRGVEVFQAALGPAHPTTAVVISNLASVLVKERKLDDAETLLRETLATLESRLGHEHPDVALPMGLLAQILVERERIDEALPMLERVLVLRQPGAAPPSEVADAHWALGNVLWDTNKDRTRAIELVERANVLYTELGGAWERRVVETQAWLDEHSTTARAQ
ncbi:MAG: tetratricopeptide repeat protein [Myxococcota bacterium]